MNIRVKFDDSRLNKQWPLFDLWPAGPVLRTFVQYMIEFCSRSDAASNVISGWFEQLAVPDKPVKCCDSRLNRSPEIRP